ncbi:MAG: pyridoxal phosphate-dependent aminotransferase [Acidobacteria bacterium]|nr:pyridoxal phosphate-dependent aminotransferase [Acidobacteriota bacterium]
MKRSSRLPQDAAPNALSAALEEARALGRPILDLTRSNPTTCGFAYPEGAIRAALGSPDVLAHAPGPRGSRSARQAIAAHLGHGLRAEDLLLTASTSEAYAFLFKMVADPGDEILVPSPSYPLFEWLARMEGLQAIPVPAWWRDRWSLDEAALEAACGPRARALCIVNPNNPTGQYLSRDEWRMLTAFCARNQLALICDEVFADFPLEPGAQDLGSALEDGAPPCPVFVLSGLSKTALLPQVKLGWIVVRGPGATQALEDLEFISDHYLSVSASAQAAAPDLLRLAPTLRAQALVRAQTNLAALDAWLQTHPACSRLPVGGGWSVLLRRPAVETDDAFAIRLLEREGVLVHPGHFFDLPLEGFVVLSLLTPEAEFEDGLTGLSRALANG